MLRRSGEKWKIYIGKGDEYKIHFSVFECVCLGACMCVALKGEKIAENHVNLLFAGRMVLGVWKSAIYIGSQKKGRRPFPKSD